MTNFFGKKLLSKISQGYASLENPNLTKGEEG
jgi:hypothetical protein